MTYHIYYAVIALTIEEVEYVISSLNERGLNELSDWLAKHKKIYGDSPDNWKPFGDQTISDIIQDKQNCYICETPTIFKLHNDCSNTRIIRSIDVFFIDIFTMYIQKYKNLATRVDHSFMNASDSKCCFVINYTLQGNHQEELEKECTNIWNEVLEGYEEGYPHRIAARVNDLKNFKNFIKRYLKKKQISPRGDRNMGEFLQGSKYRDDDMIGPDFG